MTAKNIEDIYPLSPIQQGMLFHTLYAPQSAIYCEQLGITFHTPLDVAAFKAAWQHVIERHTILRTAFAWEGLDEPMQIVRQRVKVSWAEQDLRERTAPEQAEQINAFRRADRMHGFELSRAPLMRLALLRLSPHTTYFHWSHHHLLLDGWSVALLLDEVFASYEAMRQGHAPALPQPRPYRDYIAWLQQQDLTSAETFWRQYLTGFTTPISLTVAQPAAIEGGSAELDILLSRDLTATVQRFTAQYGLTLNTLMQGDWALLLSRYSGETDVVFGTTVSTRPAALAGVEMIVGLLINTLPARVHISPEAELVPWLKRIQQEQAETRQYDYAPLVQIQQWSEVRRGRPLFESLLVVENYPVKTAQEPQQPGESPRSREVWWGIEETNYPLSLDVAPGDELRLRISYERKYFEESEVQRLLALLQRLLEEIVAQPAQRLGKLLTEPGPQQIARPRDDRDLPPEKFQSGTEVSFVPPRNSVEEALASIWIEILGLTQVGMHDNFFELGGHSLLATRVVSSVREVFQIDLPLRTLFDAPTIARLAETIIRQEIEGTDSDVIGQILAQRE